MDVYFVETVLLGVGEISTFSYSRMIGCSDGGDYGEYCLVECDAV
jgi:hypothetical protein